MSRTFPATRRAFVAPVVFGIAACTASSAEVAPPEFDPYFPTAVAVSADEKYLFVLNANADLRYDSGTIQVYDLDALESMTQAWEASVASGQPTSPAGAECTPEVLYPLVASCPTTLASGAPASFVKAGAAIRVGNYGTALGLQPLVEADGAVSPVTRVFATVRGDPSLTYADFDAAAGALTCGAGASFARCSEDHRLDDFQNDSDLESFPDEPFGLAVDMTGERAFVTHLTTGSLSLASTPRTRGSVPMLVDNLTDLFVDNVLTGYSRAASVAVRSPGGVAYVTSSSEARITVIHVAEGAGGVEDDVLAAGTSFYYDEGSVLAGQPGNLRGITFTDDGDRAFVVSRLPASLLAFDTSLGETGAPRNEFLGSVEVCSQGSTVRLAQTTAGLRAYLPCYGTGQLWVVDADRMTLVDTADVGQGPQSIAVAPVRGRAYVANYAEDTIAVVDVRPGSVDENHPVLRVGKPRLGSVE